MVHLILASTKGNGLRYFPSSGYLGLTPVKVEGVVITRCDVDQKVLSAKSITISVRCYEYRVGRAGIVQSNRLVDFTQILWAKPQGQSYADIGDLELPFRITIPVRVGGFSTATYVDYRCVWRVEAVLNHAPTAGVGSRQVKHSELPLARYDIPKSLGRPNPPSDKSNFYLETTKPRAPRLRYSIDVSSQPTGPMDLLSIPILVQPLDPQISLRSASLVVERRIQLHEVAATSKSPTEPSSHVAGPIPSSSHSHSRAVSLPPSPVDGPPASTRSLASTNSSNPTITPHSVYPLDDMTPLLYEQGRPDIHPSKLITHSIALTESSSPFSLSEDGVWSKTLTLQWPTTKSTGRWTIGETTRSELASVRFFARVKIVVLTPAGSDTLDLKETEIFVTSVNDSDRKVALAKHDDNRRSQSKSPRRSRREKSDNAAPPIPTPDSATFQTASTSSAQPISKSKPASRRPHTSAGPRDKPDQRTYYTRNSQQSSAEDSPTATSTNGADPAFGSSFRRWRSTGASAPAKKDVLGYIFNAPSPRISPAASGSSSTTCSGTSASTVSSQSSHSDDVREWEEELVKIESKSRRSSSNMLNFARGLLRSGKTTS